MSESANVRQNDDFEIENFWSPNYNKFAVECDWNNKISQTRKSAFLEKK